MYLCRSGFTLGILSFFLENKESLFVGCKEYGIYSHCQEYYLFQYETRTSRCQRFKRQPCYVLLCNVMTRRSWSELHRSHPRLSNIVLSLLTYLPED